VEGALGAYLEKNQGPAGQELFPICREKSVHQAKCMFANC
jgi:hypothetical protein